MKEIQINNYDYDDFGVFGSNCEIVSALFKTKNAIINDLYDEKEMKIRDFVLEQEEIFEEKRCEVKRHQMLLKKMLHSKESVFGNYIHHNHCNHSTEGEKLNCQCACHKKEMKEKDMFVFDEDECEYDNHCEIGNELKRLKKLDKRVFGESSEMSDEKDFPTSFREYTLSKVGNAFDDELY